MTLDGQKPKVLVGEDARPLLLLITRTLQAGGFEVATATSGRQAIELAQQFVPDIVLLDVRMPETDGISACQAIRREAVNENLPVIIMSGFDDESVARRALEAGAAGFITKPLDWASLAARIRAVLSAAATRDEPRTDPALSSSATTST